MVAPGARGRPAERCVVVSFAARDGDPYARSRITGQFVSTDHEDAARWGPTLRALADPRSELRGRVSDWYYLCHPAAAGGGREVARSALEVAPEMEAAIVRHLPEALRPRLHVVTWRTSKPPTDHTDLFEVVRNELCKVRAAHPGVEIVLSLS